MLGPELDLPDYLEVDEQEIAEEDVYRRWPETHNELLVVLYRHWSKSEWLLVGTDETLEWQVGESDFSKLN